MSIVKERLVNLGGHETTPVDRETLDAMMLVVLDSRESALSLFHQPAGITSVGGGSYRRSLASGFA